MEGEKEGEWEAGTAERPLGNRMLILLLLLLLLGTSLLSQGGSWVLVWNDAPWEAKATGCCSQQSGRPWADHMAGTKAWSGLLHPSPHPSKGRLRCRGQEQEIVGSILGGHLFVQSGQDWFL